MTNSNNDAFQNVPEVDISEPEPHSANAFITRSCTL